MKIKALIGLVIGLSIYQSTFAADQVAKEETTPPAAEGALTADQIPPIDSLKSGVAPKQSTLPGNTTSTTVAPAMPEPAIENAAAQATGSEDATNIK